MLKCLTFEKLPFYLLYQELIQGQHYLLFGYQLPGHHLALYDAPVLDILGVLVPLRTDWSSGHRAVVQVELVEDGGGILSIHKEETYRSPGRE